VREKAMLKGQQKRARHYQGFDSYLLIGQGVRERRRRRRRRKEIRDNLIH
jgi:hypothetical protein